MRGFTSGLMGTLIAVLLALPAATAAAGGAAEEGSGARVEYLAGQGIIVHPRDLQVSQFIWAIDYGYPEPDAVLGVYAYPGQYQVSTESQEVFLSIGMQAARRTLEELPRSISPWERDIRLLSRVQSDVADIGTRSSTHIERGIALWDRGKRPEALARYRAAPRSQSRALSGSGPHCEHASPGGRLASDRGDDMNSPSHVALLSERYACKRVVHSGYVRAGKCASAVPYWWHA